MKKIIYELVELSEEGQETMLEDYENDIKYKKNVANFVKFAKSLDIKVYQKYRRISLRDDYLVDCFNNNYDMKIINFIEFMHDELCKYGELKNFPYEF